ncbi:hypothetical protein HW532_12745 [Kaustia mangrovi]|uniref:F5/8 type C domain-containing protein n=1 Tax=Kaustia mangrovi TaxID=2593653 RepID=A0A7S8HCC7_9HYPH|nr:hypothetical protein [Kaustia mangrovi]QPC43486.1 hypothetical protein HW532_12745 [Kaustia mangrovi]
MIIIGRSLVLSAPAGSPSRGNPVIGWHNLVTASTVTADTTEPGYPARNLANPSTTPLQSWQAADTTAQALTASLSHVGDIDYVGLAGHNLGAAGIPVTILGSADNGVTWSVLVEQTVLPDNTPALFWFEPQSLTDVQVALGTGAEPARIAVMYIGKLLVMERAMPAGLGFTATPYGRVSETVNGRSESGDFLGRIVVNQRVESAVDFYMSRAFFREQFDPFLKAAVERPFFFAWAPTSYPRETGFVWLTNDPQPIYSFGSRLERLHLEYTGIVS